MIYFDQESETVQISCDIPTFQTRNETMNPVHYRLKQCSNGDFVLQGMFKWWTNQEAGIEWRDLKTVKE